MAGTENVEAARVDIVKIVSVGVPLLATSIAIFYDVGFFYALDASFFTFFSVSEHFVFALQALPFASVPALWLVSLAIVAYVGDRFVTKKEQEIRQRYSKLTDDELTEADGKVKTRMAVMKIVLPILVTGVLVFGVILLIKGYYIPALFSVIGALWPFLLELPIRSMSRERRIFAGLALLSVIWVLAFTVGYELGEALFSSKPHELVTIDGVDVPSRLVRVGERGVLFVVVNEKKTRFARWEDIKKIETIPQ